MARRGNPVTKGKPSPRGRGRQASTRRQHRGTSTLFFLCLGIMVVFAPVLTALLLVGLLPTIVILLVDTGPEKLSRLSAMFGFNASGVLPYAVALWESGLQMQHFTSLVSDITAWAIIYGAAGAGAAAIWLGPVIAAFVQQLWNADRIGGLDRERKALIAEWGEEVARGIEDGVA